MARTKGAKNKPKYQLDIVHKPTEMGDYSVFDTKKVQVESEPFQKKKRHRRTKAEMEAYRASLKAQEQSQDDTQVKSPVEESEPLESTKDTKSCNNSDSEISFTPELEISVGVDLNPEINSENYINNVEVENEPKKSKKSKQTKSTYPLCDCCQQEIYCQPHRLNANIVCKIDTNIISAQVADYHRVSPRWVNLCSSCAKKLSDVIDNWLQENGCITRMEQRMLDKENKGE